MGGAIKNPHYVYLCFHKYILWHNIQSLGQDALENLKSEKEVALVLMYGRKTKRVFPWWIYVGIF